MSSLFEIPARLALLLQLVAHDPAHISRSALELAPEMTAANPAEQRIEVAGFAFSEERWLELLHVHGAETGLGAIASRIFRTRSGVLYVPVASERAALQSLRRDPAKAFAVARAAALNHAAIMAWSLSRRPTATDLLIAHLSDAREASALIEAAARTPQRTASELAPRAALAHATLFFDGVRARSAGEVLRHLERALERAAQRHEQIAAVNDIGWQTVVSPRQAALATTLAR